jgi:hypothetical protein
MATLKKMEAVISKAIGQKVEITIRAERVFTFSTEELSHDLPHKIKEYFGAIISVDDYAHDDECGTFVYVTSL